MARRTRRNARHRYSKRAQKGRLGSICAICHAEIDLRLKPSAEKLAMSIDHIIPRWLNGKTTANNIRPTHKVCNNTSDVSIHKEQMRLRTMWRRWAEYTQVVPYIPINPMRVILAMKRAGISA